MLKQLSDSSVGAIIACVNTIKMTHLTGLASDGC